MRVKIGWKLPVSKEERAMKRKWIAMEEIRALPCEHCGQRGHLRSCIAEMQTKVKIAEDWADRAIATANQSDRRADEAEANVALLQAARLETQEELVALRTKVTELAAEGSARVAEIEAIKSAIVKADDVLIQTFTEEVAKIREDDEEKIQ